VARQSSFAILEPPIGWRLRRAWRAYAAGAAYRF
jgi:hypothetical protein